MIVPIPRGPEPATRREQLVIYTLALLGGVGLGSIVMGILSHFAQR